MLAKVKIKKDAINFKLGVKNVAITNDLHKTKKKLFERGILVADGNRYTHINYVYMMREVKKEMV